MGKWESIMKVTTITVSRAVKVNLGNYENTDISVSVSVAVEDGTIEDAYDEASHYVRDMVRAELAHLTGHKKDPARYGV